MDSRQALEIPETFRGIGYTRQREGKVAVTVDQNRAKG
jgi:hypothetical protein